MPARPALIVVDVQNDFCEGGALAVDGGAAAAARIADHVERGRDRYAAIVITRDMHVDPGGHFAEPGTDPDFTGSWPVHCVAGTPGAALHENLGAVPVYADAEFHKGAYTAAYSGFEGVLDQDPDRVNVLEPPVRLAGWLRDRDIREVEVVGIATDHCVKATALDAVTAGFEVTVWVELCAGVAPDTTAAAIAEMEAAGVAVMEPGTRRFPELAR